MFRRKKKIRNVQYINYCHKVLFVNIISQRIIKGTLDGLARHFQQTTLAVAADELDQMKVMKE